MRLQDRLSIGVSPEQKEFLEELVRDFGLFDQNMDAAKFAMALAIRRGLTSENAEGTETAWATGNFDPDLTIKALVQALFPDQATPYRFVEALIQSGLRAMQEAVRQSGDINLVDLLGSSADEEGANSASQDVDP